MHSSNDQTKSKCPWASTNVKCDTSILDVMSEQLADHLQTKENTLELFNSKQIINVKNDLKLASEKDVSPENNTDNDFLLAQLLQLEMDKEYDLLLKKQEIIKNRNSNGIWQI
jgi:hypothetical protein